MMANEVLDRIRSQVSRELLPSLEQHLQQLCLQTGEEAKREFVEKNFDGRRVDELKDLVERLQLFFKKRPMRKRWLNSHPIEHKNVSIFFLPP